VHDASLEGFLSSVALRPEKVARPDAYPFTIPAVRHLERIRFHPRVTFFVGENGSGKSTLVEAIAVAAGFNREGGSNNFSFATRDSVSDLHGALRLARSGRRPQTQFFLRAESFHNLATNIEELDREPASAPPIIDSYGGRSLHEMSHGESFLTLLNKRFGDNGLYILDEPEAALSPRRQLAALARIHALAEAGSQFIIATHSPLILSYPKATIFALADGPMRQVRYEETDAYRVTSDFLEKRDEYLRQLIENT
jgi:predicted ATPase